MSLRPSTVALVVALTALAGCGGGGAKVGESTFSCLGGDPRAICLANCNLGCSMTGCQRTNIAQNEIIILQFSEAIDPASVSPSTIRFRNAAGDQPVGELFVNGAQVEFVPTLSISGGQTFFGFAPGETYTMTIPGGDGQVDVVRSTSGKPFEKTLTCTLQSTLGIIDHNGVSPSATMVVPTLSQIQNAPRSTLIVLEFNELIDATPFLSGTLSPVGYAVRRTIIGLDGTRQCDPNSDPVTVPGSLRLDFDAPRGVSVLTFQPAAPLPGNVCVEVAVTNVVQDLSGRPAQSQVFRFMTEVVPQVEGRVTETFDGTEFFDANASAGTWGGGVAGFARIGGDGRHGEFKTSLGTDDGIVNGKRQFTINTDNTIISAEDSLSGGAVAIVDGRYFFSSMVVPSDVRLKFVGTSPPVITVAGRLDILGEIDIAGQSLPLPLTSATTGQVGGLGGIFAGSGGQGGDKGNGIGGPILANLTGRNGQAARVIAGHGYASSVVTSGGRGSSVFPTNGMSSSLIFGAGTTIAYTPSAAAGGGGGGHWQPGEDGRVVSNNHIDPNNGTAPHLGAMGPVAAAGTAVQLFPVPAGALSSLHFLVGGSGGGGAGSHACLTFNINPLWAAGGGGGGGGGAIALRAGSLLRLAPGSAVLARGGSTANSSGLSAGVVQPAPGGGGSGGAIVLQSGTAAEIMGSLDVRGGTGGTWNRTGGTPATPPGGATVSIKGGDGAPGFVRLELPGTPTTALLAGMQPPPVPENVAPLVERDPIVSIRSAFYSTGLLFGPDYQRYEIHATVDGVPMVFSDDPAVSNVAAQPGSPLRALFQAATLDTVTGLPIEKREWRTSVRSSGSQVGIASDGLTAFRFVLVQDTAVAQTVVVDKIEVVYMTSN